MLNWRLLLATGRRRYADEMERALYNAVAVGLSADGTRFFYSNPLQLRAGHDGAQEDSPSQRLPWYGCPCCPPNLARLGASLHHYVATGGGDAIQLHLYAAGRIAVELEGGLAELDVATDYPWQGRVTITVVQSPAGPWELALRRPGWCETVTVSGADLTEDDDGILRGRQAWAPGQQITIEFAMPVRAVTAHPSVDAVRGCAALQRGPLVYCLEQRDQPAALQVDDMTADLSGPAEAATAADGTVTLTGVGASGAGRSWAGALYRPAPATGPDGPDGRDGPSGPGAGPEPVRWVATPYYRWANRGPSAMRVWLPVTPASPGSPADPGPTASPDPGRS
jgi:DUF1680 family protein